jgi:ethanolamine ammonia-lyase small subunit
MTSLPPGRTLRDLRQLTPARVGLGRIGASLPTDALLRFTRDHARARDAVHAAFDADALLAGLRDLGLLAMAASSRVRSRRDYLARPDLGRLLDPESRRLLASRTFGSPRLVLVIGDGLSPLAVSAQAIDLVRHLVPRLAGDAIEIGLAVVACGARVALGDEIGEQLGADMVVVLIGERPGLSAPHSLGAYLTFAPQIGRTDAERNCVSNIHEAGLTHDEAAMRIAWLIREGLGRRLTGVALKDESAAAAAGLIAAALSRGKTGY